MKRYKFPLIYDPVFHRVFGEPGCEPLLKGLVNAAFEAAGLPLVVQLSLQDGRHREGSLRRRDYHLDVLATDETGRQINVEVQTYPQRSYIERSLVYWAATYARQLEKGKEYSELRPVVSLNLLDYRHFEDEQYFRRDQLVLTEHLTLLYLELPKIPDSAQTDSLQARLKNLELWGKFIQKEGKAEVQNLVERLPDLVPVHRRWEAVMALTADAIRELREWKAACDAASRRGEEERLKRQAREEGLAEGRAAGLELGRAAGIELGRKEGREEGREEGRKEGREALSAVARNLLQTGMPAAEVARVTGLDRDTVARLVETPA